MQLLVGPNAPRPSYCEIISKSGLNGAAVIKKQNSIWSSCWDCLLGDVFSW